MRNRNLLFNVTAATMVSRFAVMFWVAVVGDLVWWRASRAQAGT
jgi:hypothetical protein